MDQGKQNKLLLLGRAKAGKTSIHSIIFANYHAYQTEGIGYTPDKSEQKIKFMGDFALNLWDCGGQEKLMEKWFNTQKTEIFSGVSLMIYVIDATNKQQQYEMDLENYDQSIKCLRELSPNSKIFVLLHKKDLLTGSDRDEILRQKSIDIESRTQGFPQFELYKTTIWDESLYYAWSRIVQQVLPDLALYQRKIQEFCRISGCDEVVLFEKETFLIIATHDVLKDKNFLQYERVSNIIKQFKLTCMSMNLRIESLKIKKNDFQAIIREFTKSTYVMVVFKEVMPGAVEFNLSTVSKLFSNAPNEKQTLQNQW